MLDEKALEIGKHDISRRNFIVGAGAAIGGFAAGGMFGINVNKAEAAITLPWPFPAGGLNIDLVKQRAFEGYFGGGCCFGAAKGLIDTLAEQSTNNPWLEIPLDMFKWGAGGGLSWGTICGALNGVMPVLNLLVPTKVSAFADNILDWYSDQNFPNTTDAAFENWLTTNHPTYAGYTLIPTVSDSPLCHVSVSTWCAANEKTVGSEEKKVRCARVTAETAGYAAQLLNDWLINGVAVAGPGFDATTGECMSCHTTTYDNQQGKMACGECHTDKSTDSYTNTTPVKCTR